MGRALGTASVSTKGTLEVLLALRVVLHTFLVLTRFVGEAIGFGLALRVLLENTVFRWSCGSASFGSFTTVAFPAFSSNDHGFR